jgi:hypothetical protein
MAYSEDEQVPLNEVGPVYQAPAAPGGDDWFAGNAPPAGSTTPAAPAAPQSPARWDEQYFISNFGRPGTPQELIALEEKIKAAGGEVMRNAAGVAGKIRTPDGRIIDVINSAGIGGKGFQWLDGPGGPSLGGFGSLAQGWDKQFSAPSIEEIRNSPGYQFALNENVGALDKSAAAKGTVLSGGHKKDLLQYATGLLDQTAQQKYQNALGEYMNAYSIFRNNGNDLFDRFNTLAQQGTGAASAATS